MEGAIMSDLVTKKEREPFFVNVTESEAFVLKAEGALSEPPRLSQLQNEEFFGRVLRIVFGNQRREKSIEGGAIFTCDDQFPRSKAVLERVARGSVLPFSGSRAGRMLGIGSVGGGTVHAI
jgi:hypothetical protein